MKKILILPDIHGRVFWKEPCEKHDEYDKIIFLGDYVDSYSHEMIGKKDTVENMLEIIDFKTKVGDKCVLLVGNHDMSYIDEQMIPSRHDWANHKWICEIFAEFADYFNLAYEANMNNQRYLFSHSGIEWPWVKSIKEDYHLNDITKENIVESLNSLYQSNDKDLVRSILDRISVYRGGEDIFGSCVWGDVRSFMSHLQCGDEQIEDAYQIFGHTMLKEPCVTDKFACLDCLRPFVLNEGKIYNIDGSEVEIKQI